MFIKEKIKNIPEKPGIYQYFDKNNKIIYIGKAKNLKKRVASYFTKNHSHGKIKILVSQIRDIRYTVVETETDALLLENNLIKKYSPKYNVLLKDDKTYPWIVIKNEPFPRVFLTRQYIQDGSTYFGPYTSVKLARSFIQLFHKLFFLRTCKHSLTPENIKNKKFKVCLEYHIKRCKAPCVGYQDKAEYLTYIDQVKHILKGNIRQVAEYLETLMMEYAQNLAFEKAQEIKEKLEFIKRFQAKSTVVNPSIHNVDVCSIISDEKNGYINYLRIIDGAIIQTHSIRIHKKLDETDEELLAIGITEFRQRFNSNTMEMITPYIPDFKDDKIHFTVPQIGDKKKLLDLSIQNARYLKMDYDKQQAANKGKNRQKIILELLQKDLKLPQLPTHIECFDNSNIQGTNPVASCVVFKNGKPSKNDYRKFNIKTVEGANDFASIEEVVFRRYSRLMDENKPLPQLIVIDGGKGQLSAALNSIKKLKISHQITVIGIAKKLEEIYLPGHSLPLYLDKKSPSLRLIQQIRDEAHRFGITFHRDKRSKSLTKSVIDDIEGIGPKTKIVLLSHFKDIEEIKKTDIETLTNIIGKHKATLIKNKFPTE